MLNKLTEVVQNYNNLNKLYQDLKLKNKEQAELIVSLQNNKKEQKLLDEIQTLRQQNLTKDVTIDEILTQLEEHKMKINDLQIELNSYHSILDLVSPSISFTARQGAGFGIGANLVGFPGRKI